MKFTWLPLYLKIPEILQFRQKNLEFKGIGGGVDHVFYKLILFYRVITKLQVAFYRLKKFKLFFEI